MTAQTRSARHHTRIALRRFVWRVNRLLALAILLAVLLPGQARAYPMGCKRIPHGQLCRSSVDGMKTARCDRGYELKPNWTCQLMEDES